MSTEKYNDKQELEYDEIGWNDNDYNRILTKKCENVLMEAVEQYSLDKAQGHDKLFKEVLSEKADFKEFITNFVDEKLEQVLQNNDIEEYDTEFITSNFLQVESDIIYKAKEKPIYFIVEHQSTIDNNMAYRMLVYVTELIKKDVQKRERLEGEYPLVIPIVINTANRRWKAATKYSQKVTNYPERNMLDLEYYLVDIQNYSMAELFEKKTMVAYAMMIEKAKDKKELLETLKEIIKKIDKKYVEKMERILKFLLSSVIPEKEIEIMIKELKKKEKAPMPNVIERIIEKEKKDARKIGRKEGRQEGRQEGRKESREKIIKNMVAKNIPISTIAELTEALEEEIEKILKKR